MECCTPIQATWRVEGGGLVGGMTGLGASTESGRCRRAAVISCANLMPATVGVPTATGTGQ